MLYRKQTERLTMLAGVMNGELVREAAEHKTGQRNQVDEVFAKITLV